MVFQNLQEIFLFHNFGLSEIATASKYNLVVDCKNSYVCTVGVKLSSIESKFEGFLVAVKVFPDALPIAVAKQELSIIAFQF